MSEVMTKTLEDELLDHLTEPESAMAIFKERLHVDLLIADELMAMEMLPWVMAYIHDYGQSPSRPVLEDEFPWLEFGETVEPVQSLIDRLRKRHLKNEVKDLTKKLARQANSSPREAADAAWERLTALRHTTASRRGSLDLSDWMTVLDDYKRNILDGGLNGITFGFSEMDDLLGGLRKGGLYYIIARPKRYKSWFQVKSAVEAAKAGRKVMIASLEMSAEETMQRAQCMFAGVSWSRHTKGQKLSEEYTATEDLRDGIEGQLNVEHPERGRRTVQDLLVRANELEAEVVYVDQLKFLEPTRRVKNDARWLEIEYINEDLKEASHTIPFYVSAQFNREAANLKEMADLSKIGLSDSIGQTADMLLGLYQSREMRDSGLIEIGTIESRSFEHARWLVGIELSKRSDFKLLNRIEED